MKAVLARLLASWGAFGACALLFPGSCTLWGVFWGGLVFALLALLVRPLIQTICLPLNLLLLDLITPLTDGLLVLWACAWTPGTSLSFWAAVLAGLLAALFYLPWTQAKRKKLLKF